jgi:hypothetical protein
MTRPRLAGVFLCVGAGYAGDGVEATWLSPLKRLPQERWNLTFSYKLM